MITLEQLIRDEIWEERGYAEFGQYYPKLTCRICGADLLHVISGDESNGYWPRISREFPKDHINMHFKNMLLEGEL